MLLSLLSYSLGKGIIHQERKKGLSRVYLILPRPQL